MTRTARRVGIVLFQLGGPDTLEAIEPFLYNLFCDPDIIDFARIGRKPLAKLISTTALARCSITIPPSAGSPIRPILGGKLAETELRGQGIDAHCFVAMRYWHPFTVKLLRSFRPRSATKSFCFRCTRSIPRRRRDQA
jgi:ferrochelatase